MPKPSPINPDSPPIVRLVETLIHDAAARRAFEAVIDLRDGNVRVRFRIDREMHDRDAPPAALLVPVLARIKKLAAANVVCPSTPSGQRPIYTKPPALKRKGKPGAKPGHKGSRRARPERIDRRQEHKAESCPDCHGPVQQTKKQRSRYVEDIAEDTRTETTEHILHRAWCPKCRKYVEPVVPDALPRASL